MQVNDLKTAQDRIKWLENNYFTHPSMIVECTDELLNLLQQFPSLTTDRLIKNSIRHLTQGIYSSKGTLTSEKQAKIYQLFLITHDLKPTRIKNLLEISQPVKNLTQQKNLKAVICDNQKYPIPIPFVQNDPTPCKEYFKPIIVKFGDGTNIEISQGLLAHLSEKIHALWTEKKLDKAIELKWMDSHQFDSLIAFLETSESALIDEKDVQAFLLTGAFLQIPTVLEACKPSESYPLNEKAMVFLINTIDETRYPSLVHQVEKQISQLLITALTQKPLPQNIQKKVHFIQQNIKRPITVNLSGTAIRDKDLNLLDGFPIKKLELLNCQNLSSKCFSIVKNFPHLKSIKLGGNSWIDDKALVEIPPAIEELSLSGCTRFSREGLKILQATNVIKLDIMGCNQLSDEDLAFLPDQIQALDLRFCSQIGDKTLQRLSQMSHLNHLIAANTSLKDEHIAYLPASLIILDVSGCELSDTALTAFAHMNNLTQLSLNDTNISDAGLSLIPNTVESLKLDRCLDITDKGIRSLTSRKSLKYLSLFDCPKITKRSIEIVSNKHIEIGWQEPQAFHI